MMKTFGGCRAIGKTGDFIARRRAVDGGTTSLVLKHWRARRGTRTDLSVGIFSLEDLLSREQAVPGAIGLTADDEARIEPGRTRAARGFLGAEGRLGQAVAGPIARSSEAKIFIDDSGRDRACSRCARKWPGRWASEQQALHWWSSTLRGS